MPELPDARNTRFQEIYGLSLVDSENLTSSVAIANYFEALIKKNCNVRMAANWIMSELSAALNKDGLDIKNSKVSADDLSVLLLRIEDETISGKIAKQVFESMWNGEGTADQVISSKNLKQITDDKALEELVKEVIEINSKQVENYKNADLDKKPKMIGFFVGQIMKKSHGKANPEKVNKILLEKLEK